MFKNQVAIVFCIVAISFATHAGPNRAGRVAATPELQASEDAALVQAVNSRKGVHFITASGLTVSEVLKDDTKGSPHQKFNVKLSNGRVIMIVSNLDMCEKVPVQVGDVVSAGGQFIPTGKSSGLIHWTHKDPRQKRPDGFIEFKGQIYCQ